MYTTVFYTVSLWLPLDFAFSTTQSTSYVFSAFPKSITLTISFHFYTHNFRFLVISTCLKIQQVFLHKHIILSHQLNLFFYFNPCI
ncbi:hypothetical protein GLYMA_09G233850v4 [Glycine max]|nr:hypothetical protein GLYMA_09G233850v4 [Glycine max]